MREFINAMENAGVVPPTDITADGHIHRFDNDGDKPGSKNCWYVLFDDPPGGAFGDWKRNIHEKWSCKDHKVISPEVKASYKANVDIARRAKEAKQDRIHSDCREQSAQIWEQAQSAPLDHPYLQRKGVKGHGIKVYKGSLLVPIMDGSIIHGLQFISANGDKRFKRGTNKKGNYFFIGENVTRIIYMAEGYATAATIYQATGEPVVVCFDAGNLKRVANVLLAKHPHIQLVICADDDKCKDGNPGLTKATESARSVGALLAVPRFPEGAHGGSDFNDLAQTCGLDAVREQVEAAAQLEQERGEAPLPLPNELLPVKPFDYDLLPDSFRPWAQDISERMQCPPDFVAVAVVTALGSVIGRKVGIRPQNKTTWTAVPNMWGIIVGKPGVMKSPALNEALKPLNRLATKAVSEFAELKKQHNVEAARADAIISANGKKIKRIAGEESKDAELTELILQNESLRERRDFLLTPRRYLANDSSYQALGELLRHNPNGLLVFRDELVSLIKGLDREEQADARGFYLQGWNGDSDYTFDRIGRGMNLYIPGLCISMLGGTQPGKISEYVRHAVRGGSGDDGLIQRFGVMVWPDIDKKWKNVDRQPDTEAENKAFEAFERLDLMKLPEIAAEQDTNEDGESDGIPYLRMTSEAQEVFLDWRESLEDRIRGDELPDPLSNHFAKYRKLIPALALILHLAEGDTGSVSRSAVTKALAWAAYLESHAWRVYGSHFHHEVTTAKNILAKIEQKKLKQTFSSRDVWRPNWATLTDRDKVSKALDLLVDHRWLTATVHNDTGGRPATSYTLNPEARL